MKRLKQALFFFSFLLFTLNLNAQIKTDSTTLWKVSTTDGNEYVGQIIDRNETAIILKTELVGTISIKHEMVEHSAPINQDNLTNGVLNRENLTANHYLLFPSAYNLKQGEGYYRNIWIFFNEFNYGITDNISLGLGVVPTFTFGIDETPVWFAPKISIPIQKDKLVVSVGTTLFTLFGDNSGVAAYAYGVATYGSRSQNVSFGLGYGNDSKDWADRPLITFAGMIRTGKNHFLMTDNFIITYDDETVGLLSFGGRFVGKHIVFDYGGFMPIGDDNDQFYVIPYLSITFPFGKLKH